MQQVLSFCGDTQVNSIAVGGVDRPVYEAQAFVVELPRLLGAEVEEAAKAPQEVELKC